ncbi:sugar transporter [Ascosphaera apis ARSEF 7405]|uniref:Sugar transporter n=1 Tax=Ascosphaera apis ARSEF 7405 TaxID=392613 RepID=A0A168AI55_9EURO|nr:sugar transporter [Ascosphaera apis ARSEF 7405]
MGIIKSPALRKRLAYGFFATSLQQAGGIAALTMYAVTIYKSLGWDQGSQALAINGTQACLQLAIVLVNTFTVDRYGRKTLLLFGFAIQALALLLMSTLLTVYPNNENRPASVVCVICLFVVGLTYCFSNGPIAPTVASEIFPQHVRDKAFSLSLLGQTAFLLAIDQPWPDFNNKVGGKSYWLLFGLNTLCFILVLLFLPETKGISLEKMDSIFGAVDYGQNNDRIDGEKLGKDSMDLKKAPVEVEIVPATNSDAVTPVASRKMHEDLETHKV